MKLVCKATYKDALGMSKNITIMYSPKEKQFYRYSVERYSNGAEFIHNGPEAKNLLVIDIAFCQAYGTVKKYKAYNELLNKAVREYISENNLPRWNRDPFNQ